MIKSACCCLPIGWSCSFHLKRADSYTAHHSGNFIFEPVGRRTEPTLALDYLNKVVTRRAVVFFISDFQAPDFSQALAVTGRRHDFIAIRVEDEREKVFQTSG